MLQESMELVYNKSKPVAVTGMAFPAGDVNNFVVGSEEGTVYTASRHGRLVEHTQWQLKKCKKFTHKKIYIFACKYIYLEYKQIQIFYIISLYIL